MPINSWPLVPLEKFQNIQKLYDRTHAPIWKRESEFLESRVTSPMAKSRFKKFSFLLTLDGRKANSWIWDKVCEDDFLSLMEGLIHIANEQGKMELVDELLIGFSWNDELTSITETFDFTSSGAAKELAQSYGQTGLKLPEEFREFEKYVLSGVSMKDVFYTKIFPKALKNENSSELFGYDKDELLRIADLRFSNSREGFESMKTEYTALETQIWVTGKASIWGARKYRKRKLELEFMYCFLMNLQNSGEMQVQLEKAFQSRLLEERIALRDKDEIWILRLLFEMSTGEDLAKFDFRSPYSHCYFLSLFLPALRLFGDLTS